MQHNITRPRRHAARMVAAVVVATTAGATLAACTGDGGAATADCPDGVTEITLSGPNQWTTDGDTFGPAWEDLVASFKEVEPCITLKTNVLPLDSFFQTISTQLAAGSATELVFGASTHEPHMIYALNDDLEKPNPYVDGNSKWIDLFNPDYFTVDKVANTEGGVESIPFNLVGVAVFYNKTAFDEAGLSGPPETFEDFISACDALTDAGYTPYAMDNGQLGTGWTIGAITAQFLSGRPFEEWNVYDTEGNPGTADPLTGKSIARAIATGEFAASIPEVQEALEQTKRMWDHCVDPNWSGVAGTSASLVGAEQFISGQAAMSIGVNFGVAELDDVGFEVGSMPLPTVTTETSDLVSGEPARFGTGLGGTSYSIPSTIEGDKLAAAIKFLQFVSAPEHIEPWLAVSGGIPVLKDVTPADNVAGFLEGDWAKPFHVGYGILQVPATTTNANAFGGYLLGTKDLATQTSDLQALYDERLAEDLRNNPDWASEDWAQ